MTETIKAFIPERYLSPFYKAGMLYLPDVGNGKIIDLSTLGALVKEGKVRKQVVEDRGFVVI